MKKNPNPQGKGLVPVLQGLGCALPQVSVKPKHIQQITSELFTSLFVLCSDFKFRPVVGNRYWLYKVDEQFKLYMVGPDEWHGRPPGQFIGECILREDITWTLNLDDKVAEDSALIMLLDQVHRKLQKDFQASVKIEDAVGGYEASMSFHGRALAYGLGYSLRTSMQRAGIDQLSYERALRNL